MKGYGLIALILTVCLLASGCSGSSSSATVVPTSAAALPTSTTAGSPAAAGTPPTAGTPTTVGTPIAVSTPADTATAPAATQTAAPAVSSPTPTAAVPATGGQSNIPTDNAKAFPDAAGFTWAPVVSGLNRPLAVVAMPDGQRMLTVEQAGVIRVLQNGGLLADPFLDITSRVGSGGNEQGLLGLALHPDYAKNGFFYINYTNKSGNTVIARYNVSANDPNKADPNSEKVLLRQDQPFPNHNGGSMVFGPDGYLYMGLGDGGSAGDPHGNGQSTNTLLGKILRIDVNNGDPYAIPSGNPFASGGGKPEIWAYGLRNPWRFSFDRLTGDLYIADVGQNLWEEIDFLPSGTPGGTNFGWNYREGKHSYSGTPPANLQLTDPVVDYSHGFGCSVTGGYVYRGQALPEFRGIYLFADYCSGRLWGLMRGADGNWQSQELLQAKWNVTSFGQDNNGELYAVDQSSGSILRLQRK